MMGSFTIINAIITIFSVWSVSFRDKKRKEYNNDERWKTVEQKAASIFSWYLLSIMILAFVAIVLINILKIRDGQLSYSEVASLTFTITSVPIALYGLALKYYDSRI